MRHSCKSGRAIGPVSRHVHPVYCKHTLSGDSLGADTLGLGTGAGANLSTEDWPGKPPPNERLVRPWAEKVWPGGDIGAKFEQLCAGFGLTRAKHGTSWDDKCIGHMYERNLGPWAKPSVSVPHQPKPRVPVSVPQRKPETRVPLWVWAAGIGITLFALGRRST